VVAATTWAIVVVRSTTMFYVATTFLRCLGPLLWQVATKYRSMSTPEIGGIAWCFSSYFSTNTASQKVFCLVARSEVPTIAQTVERRDRALVFFFGMDIPQRAF
jgi:hypothetical protein